MESDDKKQQKPLPECPLEKSSILSYILFAWLLPVFIKGNKKELTTEDLYRPLAVHKSGKFISFLCSKTINQ